MANSFKKTKAIIAFVLVVGLLGAVQVAKASSGLSFRELVAKFTAELAVERLVAEPPVQPSSQPDETNGEVRLGGAFNPYQMGDEVCSNDFCTVTIKQSFMASSTGRANMALLANITPLQFKVPTSTLADVVVDYRDAGFGYTIPTTTITMTMLSIGYNGYGAPTSTYGLECSASATVNTTSSPYLIDTEALIPANDKGVVVSGIASSTNTDFGSLVVSGNQTVIRGVVTPQKPYFNCLAHGTGQLDTFWNPANGSKGVVTLKLERQR